MATVTLSHILITKKGGVEYSKSHAFRPVYGEYNPVVVHEIKRRSAASIETWPRPTPTKRRGKCHFRVFDTGKRGYEWQTR